MSELEGYVKRQLSQALGSLEEALGAAFEELPRKEALKLLEELENELCGPGIFDFYSVAHWIGVWDRQEEIRREREIEETKDIGEVEDDSKRID
jgi:hypothetical protein